MNEITDIDTRRWLRTQRHILSFHLTAFHFITIGMVMTFSVLVIGTNAAARTGNAPPNPFAAFLDVFPEQSGDHVEKMGFYCLMRLDTPASDVYCSLKLAAGAVAEVNVAISGSVVHQIQFIMRQNGVRLGDLMLLLGAPEVRGSGHLMFFSWPDSRIIASALSDQPPSPFLPLQTVIVASPWHNNFG